MLWTDACVRPRAMPGQLHPHTCTWRWRCHALESAADAADSICAGKQLVVSSRECSWFDAGMWCWLCRCDLHHSARNQLRRLATA